MFIGWEGVGLCSYLLIGFWFKNENYNNAAKKAFIMNRVGDLGFLIGYHGQNLESFQSVLQLMLNRAFEGGIRVVVNVNNYREKREEVLKEMAMRAVDYVREYKVEKHLSPMKPNDRRIVHLALQDLPDISTESVGEGEERRVVIKLKEIVNI